MPTPAPTTLEDALARFLRTEDLSEKLAPELPALPVCAPGTRPALRIERPGRPAALVPARKSPKTPTGGALRDPAARARLVHTFLHHELQAAELFAFAVLAFPETPRAFREGLVGLLRSELAHLALYRAHLVRLGARVGDFPVRDWLLERGTAVPTPLAFVALVGLGFEGANLDHSARFAAWFDEAGDAEGARLLARIGAEEEGHVGFAVRWFERFAGRPLAYDDWRAELPEPLTPAVFRAPALDREARARAGLDARFLDRLETEAPTTVPARRAR